MNQQQNIQTNSSPPSATIINPRQVLSIHSKVRVRHALAQYAIQRPYHGHTDPETTEKEEIKKRSVINRTNGTTKRKETYVTHRPENYSTNPLVKLLDIWCRLRSYSGQSQLIKERKSKMTDMAIICECSVNKLRPALKELQRLGWLYMDDQVIRINSEKHVYAACELDFERKIDRIFTKPDKLQDEKTSHYWLYLADIDDNKKRQAYVFHQKIITNPELKVWLYSHMQSLGYSIAQVEKDPLLVARAMHAVYRDSFNGKESEMFDYLVENRPDVNRGVKGMGEAWNTCPQNVSYIKRKIMLELLAAIQKLGTVKSEGFKHNKHCRVMYNFKDKATFQAFCDDIIPRTNYHASETERFKIPSIAA